MNDTDRTSKQNVPERIYLGQLFRDGAYTDERRWVRAEDYDRLKAEMERLRAATVIVGELAALIPLSETIEATRTGATMVQWFKEHLRPADETTARYSPRVRYIDDSGYTPRTEVEMVPDVKGEWMRYSPEEPARELSASEAASFDKTLARSPRRVETSERPLTNCRHCDNGTTVTADGFHRISVRCTEYPNEDSSEKATQPLSDHLKPPVKAGDPCPAIDDAHTEHEGKCVYCGAPTAQVNAAELSAPMRIVEGLDVLLQPEDPTPVEVLPDGSVRPLKASEPLAHQWDAHGERCTVCGDKDWMGTTCSGPQSNGKGE